MAERYLVVATFANRCGPERDNTGMFKVHADYELLNTPGVYRTQETEADFRARMRAEKRRPLAVVDGWHIFRGGRSWGIESFQFVKNTAVCATPDGETATKIIKEIKNVERSED